MNIDKVGEDKIRKIEVGYMRETSKTYKWAAYGVVVGAALGLASLISGWLPAVLIGVLAGTALGCISGLFRAMDNFREYYNANEFNNMLLKVSQIMAEHELDGTFTDETCLREDDDDESEGV